ncbi:unnamed protein product [Rodentolepis nana]|uniref:Transcription elongation regulator 1 n=1 Tax=Rodentolepis nana TaxID=102285 RepID=A0A158QHH4_RODNA|nr:unnamed protein product [Rodentolepis nana]
MSGDANIDRMQEQPIDEDDGSPDSKQFIPNYGPPQGIPRPNMPQSFRPGMKPPNMPPMPYRGPIMRPQRPMGMRPGHHGMRPMGMPNYRGPPRPFDGPQRPPFDMSTRGPPRYPPQRYPPRMVDSDDNPDGYFDQDGFPPDDFPNMPPNMHHRGPMPPRGYGMPPGPHFMGGPPRMMNGGPSASDMGPPGPYGPPRPGYMTPRGQYPQFSPGGQDMSYDGQPGGPPPNGQPPYGVMPPPHPMLTSGNSDMSQMGHHDESSPNGGGPLLPLSASSDSDERQNMPVGPGPMPPPPMQPPFGGMPPPYGQLPSQQQPNLYQQQQGMQPSSTQAVGNHNGPPGRPYMQPPPMGFPPVPPIMHSGPPPPLGGGSGGMYSMPPPPNPQQPPPSGSYSGAHQISAPPPQPTNPRDEIWVEHTAADGKVYFYNMQTRETRWDKPERVTVIRHGDVEKPAVASATTYQAAPTSVVGQPRPSIQANPVPVKPPEVAAWTEYKSGEGKSYYHNSQSNQTTWDKPQVIIDWENSFKKIEDQPKPPVEPPFSNVAQTTPVVQSKPPEPAKVQQTPTTEKKPEVVQQQAPVAEKEPEPKKEPEQQKDSSRPISSTAVSGTPWCVVWTGDGRVFFFNPSKRISVWETPDELKGRADVERMLKKPPGDESDPSSSPKDDSTKSTDAIDNGVVVEEQEPPSKKPKLEEPIQKAAVLKDASPKPEAMVVDEEAKQIVTERIGEDAMKEALDRAAKDQASLPYEVRAEQFRQMLIDKQVSAFSTWDKELHKIVFDHRYLLLTCEERKQAFESYVRERADVERTEKKHKMREKKDKFNELLATANLNSKSSYSDFSSKYGRDERFKGIEKSRERESLFQAFISDLRRKEKDKTSSKDKLKTDFIALLKEHKSISRRSHWSDVKKKIDSDSRYRAVESSSRREDWFREYVKKLDDAKESEKASREDSEKRKEREKRERQEASLRERKKEVEEARTNSMREKDREREAHLRKEAEANFNALLTDVIKSEIMPWKDAKKLLRKNSRWDAIADVLSRNDREKLFDTYVSGLNKKTKEAFLKMLEGNESITYWTSWRDLKDILKDESRFEKLLSSEKKWKAEFRDWTQERESKAKKSFNEMLKEKTSLISSAKRQSSENGSMLDDVLSTLKADIRYRAIESGEAKKLLEEFLQNLAD